MTIPYTARLKAFNSQLRGVDLEAELDRLYSNDSQLQTDRETTTNEVVAGRKGLSSLKAKMDDIDTKLSAVAGGGVDLTNVAMKNVEQTFTSRQGHNSFWWSNLLSPYGSASENDVAYWGLQNDANNGFAVKGYLWRISKAATVTAHGKLRLAYWQGFHNGAVARGFPRDIPGYSPSDIVDFAEFGPGYFASDKINELTASAGVNVDGLPVKDGMAGFRQTGAGTAATGNGTTGSGNSLKYISLPEKGTYLVTAYVDFNLDFNHCCVGTWLVVWLDGSAFDIRVTQQIGASQKSAGSGIANTISCSNPDASGLLTLTGSFNDASTRTPNFYCQMVKIGERA